MQFTKNYKLKKPELNEYALVTDLNENADVIDAELLKIGNSQVEVKQQLTTHLADYTGHIPYAADIGTANAKAVTLNPAPTSYVDGMAIAFKNAVQNTGAVTINVNGLGAKPIVKSNGNALTSGNLKANSVYTLRYNGTSFFLQGEGGEYGTATASQVLEGYTYGTEESIQNGSMPNRGAVNQSLSANGSYTIPAGYHNGSGRVIQSLTTKATETITPGTANKTIAANQYLTGIQTILGDANLIAANILSGKSIFGVAGAATVYSLGGMNFASGTKTPASEKITVTGLKFRPKFIYAAKVGAYRNRSASLYMDRTLGEVNNFMLDDAGSAWEPLTHTVNSSGFSLGVKDMTGDYEWIAFG